MIDDVKVELLSKRNSISDKIIIHLHGEAIYWFLSIYRYIALKYSQASRV